MTERTGAELLCQALVEEGATVLFGHPGGAILPFYDALHRDGRIRHILCRHEQAAAHAADGFSRASGRVGVCVATSGPGATNLVTGLATALMDSVPMVAITGQVPTPVMGTEAFQETDILGITLPVTKHGFLVRSAAEIPGVMREAFRLARSGRPGPVLVDIPKDVQNQLARMGSGEEAPPSIPSFPPHMEAALDRAARMVNEARHPIVMAGRGVVVAGVTAALQELAERADLPVVTTLLGLDAFPGSHPLSLGLPGMHGNERSNRAIQEADVILGLGLRFDDRITGPVRTFAPNARIIHLEVDAGVVGRTVRPAVAILGDLRETLPALASRVTAARHPGWWTRLSTWPREADPAEPQRPEPGALTGRTAARALATHIAASGAVVATDVGQHQMLMAQELRAAHPRTHLSSGGLGTMGYALPAAMGAAVAGGGRPTWVVVGDGGFQMNLQELATLVQEGIPLRIAVMNNGFLGMVRQWQELFHGRRYSQSELSGPDLVLLAQAYGLEGLRVERGEGLEEAIARAEATPGPVILDLRVDREENVYPMVPPGAALHELVPQPPRAQVGAA